MITTYIQEAALPPYAPDTSWTSWTWRYPTDIMHAVYTLETPALRGAWRDMS